MCTLCGHALSSHISDVDENGDFLRRYCCATDECACGGALDEVPDAA